MDFIFFFFWIIFAVICGGIGLGRKIGFWFPFLFSLFFTPLVGFLVAITSRSLADEKRDREMLELQKEQTQNLASIKKEATQNSVASELEKLKGLLDSGHITQEEFNNLKAKVLSGGVV